MMSRVTTLIASLLPVANGQAGFVPLGGPPAGHPTAGYYSVGNQVGQPVYLTPDPTPMPTPKPTAPPPTPMPTSPIDCVGTWSAWQSCTKTCGRKGQGKQYRFYFITKQAVGWGLKCPTSAKAMPSSGIPAGPLATIATVPFTRPCRDLPECTSQSAVGCAAHGNIQFKTVNEKVRQDNHCSTQCNNIKKCRNTRPDCTKCNDQCECTDVNNLWKYHTGNFGGTTYRIEKRLKKKENPNANRRRVTVPERTGDNISPHQNGPVRRLQEKVTNVPKEDMESATIEPIIAV